ncbi:MAG: hypothetical protein U0324_45045 [Polyangiales bacterium]
MATAALPEKGPYTELAGFAQLRSLPYAGAAELVFGAAPAWVSLSLSIDSGRVCGLSVEVGGRAHPEVHLRAETDDDRAAKTRGTAVEHQTGDPAFDARIYVEAHDDEHAPRAMLTAPVRAAVLALWDLGCNDITWNGGGVQATLTEARLGRGLYDAAHVDAAVRAMLTLAAAPTPDPAARRPPPGAGLLRVTTPLMLGAVAWMIAAMVRWTPESPWLPFAGIVAGLAAWAPYRAVVARVVRGGSASHTRHWIASAFGLLGLPALGMAAAVTANGALDVAPPTLERGRILAVGHYHSDDDQFEVTVRWEPSNTTATVWAPASPRPHEGDAIAHVVHAGALGVAWGDRLVVTPPTPAR